MNTTKNQIEQLMRKLWRNQQGVLSFEWVLLITVIVIGVVGGLSAMRDSIIEELGDLCGAAVAIDQSYTVLACDCPNMPPNPCFQAKGKSFSYTDSVPECDGKKAPVRRRSNNPVNQTKGFCQNTNNP